MTQEEKAKAYDEALKKAKEIKEKITYSHLSTESCKAISEYIDTIIPELAESEDERIRKEIVSALKFANDGGVYDKHIAYLEKQRYNRMQPVYDNLDSFESALAKAWKAYNDSGARTVDGCEDDYIECAHAKGFREGYLFGLEKQKDLGKMIVVSPEVWDKAISDAYENGKRDSEKQKENPKSADSIPSDCVSDAKCEDRWHKVEDSLPNNGRMVLANDCLGNTLLARYDGEGNWEVSVYDNEDYYCRNTITKWCEIPSEKQKPAEINEYKIIKKHITEDVLSSEVNKRLKECGWYVTEKPAEWDDYTKTNLDRAIQIIKKAKGTLQGYQSDDGIYECDKAIECLEHFLYRGLEIERSKWNEDY